MGQSGLATARPAAAGWSPLDLGVTLMGWWDFSDAATLFTDAGITPVSADGQTIYQANDKSGNNYHAVQAAASRPLYKTGVQNGLSVTRFDGNTWLAMTGMTHVAGDYTFVFVHDPGATALYKMMFDAAQNRIVVAHCANGATKTGYYDGTWREVATNSGDPQIQVFRLAGGTATARLYRNGVQIGSNTDYSQRAIGGNVFLAGDTGGVSRYAGDIGEFVLCDVALSTANLNLLGNYLAAKWGISWTDIP